MGSFLEGVCTLIIGSFLEGVVYIWFKGILMWVSESMDSFALKQNVFTNALVNMEDSGVNHDDAHPLTKILCHADPLRSCVMLTH